jgi:UDP-glucose 4-epimerase
VAVTGGAGFIGSHTVEMLVARGSEVMVIDDRSHPCGAVPPAGVRCVDADCGSPEAARALAAFRPDAVLHLAAKGGVRRALADPGGHVRAVLVSSVALFEAACRAGARRVVAASSGGAMYGDPETLPAHEGMPPAPRSPYGASKAAEEVYLHAFGTLHRLEAAVALRYGNVYGPRQDGTGEAGVVAITCWRLNAGERPLVYGDGLQTRDFIHVADVARANLAALASRRSGPVNVGTGREASVREVVETLVEADGSRTTIEYRPPREGEVRRGGLDPSRAAGWLAWRPEVDLRDGLGQTYCHFQAASATPG